jgi:hypothetical protein
MDINFTENLIHVLFSTKSLAPVAVKTPCRWRTTFSDGGRANPDTSGEAPASA